MADLSNETAYFKVPEQEEPIPFPRGDIDEDAWEQIKKDPRVLMVGGTDKSTTGRLKGRDVEVPSSGGGTQPAPQDETAYMRLEGSDEPVRIPRGDLDDDEWDKIKKDSRTVLVGGSTLGPSQVQATVGKDAYERTRYNTPQPPAVAQGGGGGFFQDVARQVGQSVMSAPPPGMPDMSAVDSVINAPNRVPSPDAGAPDAGAPPLDTSVPVREPGGAIAPMNPGAADPASEASQYVQANPTPGTNQGPTQFVSPPGAPGAVDPASLVTGRQNAQLNNPFQLSMGPGPSLPPSATASIAGPLNQATDEAVAAQKKLGELESAKLEQQGKLAGQAVQTVMDSQAQIAHLQETRQREQQRAIDAIQQTAQEMGRVQSVDPNGFWNKMSTGDRVLAGISVFLGGLGAGTFAALGIKHENEALNILRDAAKRDTEVSLANQRNQREALRDQLTGKRMVFDSLREKGMDEFEAQKAEYAIKLDAIAKQIEQTGFQMGAPEAIQKAQLGAAQLRQEAAKPLMELAQHTDRYALGKAKLELGWAGMQQRARMLGLQFLHGPEAEKDADIRAALGSLNSLRGMAQKSMPVAGKVAKEFSGTDSNTYENNRNAMLEQIGPLIKGGVLREADRPYFDALIPHAGAFRADSNGKFDAAERVLFQRYMEHQRALMSAGYRAGSLPDIESGGEDLGFEE